MFQFKQFSVEHSRSPWKVGIDSILLGAWADPGRAQTIVDLGAGCGVLSLMIAQRSPAHIVAIEIDPEGAAEAQRNFAGCPWSDRMECLCMPVSRYVATLAGPAEFIISNPPYFRNTSSESTVRDLARSGLQFDIHSLADAASRILTEDGSLALVMPYELAAKYIEQLNAAGLFVNRRLNIAHTKEQSPALALVQCTREIRACEIGQMHLFDADQRSPGFRQLTSAYYI